jgi:branched-chain amino acid transport system ATP-binding protein
MKKFWQYPAGVLSGGQKQMLAIARAIIEPRTLILIDEPTKGLAPAIIEAMIAAFAELKRDTTISWSSRTSASPPASATTSR